MSDCDFLRDLQVIYCGKQCQNAHWKEHKNICGKNLSADTRDRLRHAIDRIKDAAKKTTKD